MSFRAIGQAATSLAYDVDVICKDNMKYLISVIILIIGIAAGSYYYFSEKLFVIELTEQELQEKFSQSIPYKKNYLFIVDVFLSNPRLELIEESNRVKVGLDVTLNIIINNDPFAGSIDVSGGVRYSNTNGSFFLDNPQIEALNISGVPAEYTDQASVHLENALSAYYAERPIYTLNNFESDQVLAKMVLKTVEVNDKKLLLKLGL